MDIYMLTDSLSLDIAGQKIKDANEYLSLAPKAKARASENPNVAVSSLGDSHKEHKQIFYDEIKNAITGFARIIKYTNDTVNEYTRHGASHVDDHEKGSSNRIIFENSPEHLHISEISEGSFFYGEKSGYCRILDCVKGICEVGFFHENEPRGKYCVYNLDGTFNKAEGLYENAQICKTKIQIANYMQKITRTEPSQYEY